jgi:HK97 family phage portal protein
MLDSMGAVSTLFSIVSTNANAVSQVEWKLFKKTPLRSKKERTEVIAHPALVVWNKPNQYYTRQEFVESEQQHVDLTGEGWWVTYTDPRMPSLGPTEIWPVRPDRMFPVKHPTEFLTGYVYVGPNGEEVPLDKGQVIQIRMPNPVDPYRGMGPVQSLLTNIYGYKAALDYNAAFFRNGGEAGGFLSFSEELDDDEWERQKRRWNSQHQGIHNAHRVAILEGGAQWIDRKYTNRDMEFVDLANFGRDTMREAFGMHKFILGQSDDVNLAQALAADTVFAKRQQIPRLERFKQALNNDFLPMFPGSEMLEFDYCDPSPDNPDEENAERASKTSAFKTLIDAGVNPEDAALYCDLPVMRMKDAPAVPVGGE